MPTANAIGHITITVTDIERSVTWYQKALGLSRGRDMSGSTWKRTLMSSGSGLIIGLQQHDSTPAADRFDETRVGLDHVSIACADRSEVEVWVTALDAAGVAHSPISAGPASVVTAADPDGIAIEFFAPPAS